MALLRHGVIGMGLDLPRELIDKLASARRVAVLTGAGISAESGIPTFRDALTGLWANYDPQDLATPEGFARNPKLGWEWDALARAEDAPEYREVFLSIGASAQVYPAAELPLRALSAGATVVEINPERTA